MPADPCSLLFGPARTACQSAKDFSDGASTAVNLATDPLGTIAKGCAEAAAWIIDKLSAAIVTTTTVDFTNPTFIKQYAIVFGASTFLTVILWLIAVIKRAIRGEMVTHAFGEAVGFLWLAVMASAFTPVALALLVSITDTATDAIAAGTGDSTAHFLSGLSNALTKNTDSIGGGPIMLIVLSLLALLAAAIVWIELLVRAAMLYVGAILGCAVYSGLVDRSLWRHVRRWAGIMLAVVMVKPVLVIVLGLAAAIMADNGDSLTAVLTGLAILFVSIFASVVIYRFVPTFGDDVAMSINRRGGVPGGTTAFTSPAGHVRNGMATHANRGEPRGSSAQSAAATPGKVATATAGMAAHGALRVARVGRGGGSKQQPAHAVNGGPVNGSANQSGGNGAGRGDTAGQATYHQTGQANGAANHPAPVGTAGSSASHPSPAASATIAAPRPAAETDQVTAAARPANAASKHDLRGDR